MATATTPFPPLLPSLFVPHGAPTFALNPGAAGQAMSAFAAALPRPRAIVVVSAHWEEEVPSVGSADALETIHDYHGFPSALYELRYAAHGSPSVAEEVRRLLHRNGFAARLDSTRGLDHGAWIPLRQMFPAADIPVIPLALQRGDGPAHHYRLGQALAPLLAQGILLLASGNLTHNLMDYRTAPPPGAGHWAYVDAFADWVWARLADGDSESLLNYRRLAPNAARAHPSEEHLLPLYVALGAAGPNYRAERLYAGIAERVLAMDMLAFHPAKNATTNAPTIQAEREEP